MTAALPARRSAAVAGPGRVVAASSDSAGSLAALGNLAAVGAPGRLGPRYERRKR